MMIDTKDVKTMKLQLFELDGRLQLYSLHLLLCLYH